MARIVFNDRQIELMKELYLRGMSATRISHLFGCTHNTISKNLKANGIVVDQTTATKFTSRQEQIILELLTRGMSATKLSKLFNCSIKPITRIAKERGHKFVKNNQKYNYNESYFEKIDTEEKAYWLGFIFADGSVRNTDKWQLEITLSEEDREHLCKFANVISSNGVMIKDKVVNLNGNNHKATKLQVVNKKITEDLISHKCIPNKSNWCEFPDIDSNLVRHFIRGYFDGDGSIYYNNSSKSNCINIVGCSDFLNPLFDILANSIDGFTRTNIYKSKNSVAYFIAKQGKQAESFIEWIYKDSNIYLDRKYNLYREIYKV